MLSLYEAYSDKNIHAYVKCVCNHTTVAQTNKKIWSEWGDKQSFCWSVDDDDVAIKKCLLSELIHTSHLGIKYFIFIHPLGVVWILRNALSITNISLTTLTIFVIHTDQLWSIPSISLSCKAGQWLTISQFLALRNIQTNPKLK